MDQETLKKIVLPYAANVKKRFPGRTENTENQPFVPPCYVDNIAIEC